MGKNSQSQPFALAPVNLLAHLTAAAEKRSSTRSCWTTAFVRALGVALLSAAAWAGDVVTLADGKRLEGRVVRDTSRELVLRVGTNDRRIDAKDVATVSSAARKLKEALSVWERLSPADTRAVRELAHQCKAFGLAREARVFALYGLTLAPLDEELHELAGHEKRGETWFVRDGAKREAFAKRFERKLDWGDAWELDTTHFALRSNLPLRDAVACAIELELYYRAFFGWFAEELPLYEPSHTMKASVYASSAEFPELSGRKAYFEPLANVLHVNSQDGLELGALIHEATHQVLFNTSSNTKAALGAIPAWLDEGLAEYMSACREGLFARAAYSKGKPNREHFARHRTADKAFDLSRVLAFDQGDFMASSQSDLKYAQAYTLVHFCLHGGGEEQRARFLDFFRRAYAGKSSMTAFKDAMVVKEKELEAAWREYVANEG